MQLALMSICEPALDTTDLPPFFLLVRSPFCVPSEHMATWLETTFPASLFQLWLGRYDLIGSLSADGGYFSAHPIKEKGSSLLFLPAGWNMDLGQVRKPHKDSRSSKLEGAQTSGQARGAELPNSPELATSVRTILWERLMCIRLKAYLRGFLVARWLGICLAMKGAQVPSLVGEPRAHMLWGN